MPSIDFKGCVAVVTGAGSGLGRVYALELSRRGARVIVNDVCGETCDATVAEIRAFGGRAVASQDSVTTRSGGNAIVAAALDGFGRIDILISNAGILQQARFEEMTDEDIDAIIDVHLKGSFYIGQPAFAAMKRQAYGRMLFTASSSGLFGHPWQAGYGAAKAGIIGLSNVIALEGKAHGILSNVIMPNALTGMNRDMDISWISEFPDLADTLGKLAEIPVPDGNRLDPEWVTPLALYLVSGDCNHTHGIFSACSGRYARVFTGASNGWPSPHLPSVEDIAAHWSKICDVARFAEPMSVYDEVLAAREALVEAEVTK